MEPVVGLCRFSFVGRGDWVAWRDRSADEVALLHKAADTLYDPARMEARFWTFEHLLLTSLKAQSCPDWRLIVLTSDLMPPEMRARLRQLVADEPRVEVEISSARDVDSGFLPVLERWDMPRAVQFRIDDDDCLSANYIERLQRVTRAMDGFRAWTFSTLRGLVVSLYSDRPAQGYALEMAYLGAGLAARLPPKWTGLATIYGFGHFSLAKRWHAITDNDGPGFLLTHLDHHDSARLEEGSAAMRGHEALEWGDFKRRLQADFPFLDADRLRDHLHKG